MNKMGRAQLKAYDNMRQRVAQVAELNGTSSRLVNAIIHIGLVETDSRTERSIADLGLGFRQSYRTTLRTLARLEEKDYMKSLLKPLTDKSIVSPKLTQKGQKVYDAVSRL